MSMEALLAAKPHRYSLQLLRASGTCGPIADCGYVDAGRAYGATSDPCMNSPLGCQLASSHPDWKSASYVGGAKLTTEIGKMSFSAGRHRDNLVLAQAAFVEGTYRMGAGSLVIGALRAPKLEGRNLLYVYYRATLR
jgi:hypothetical protein